MGPSVNGVLFRRAKTDLLKASLLLKCVSKGLTLASTPPLKGVPTMGSMVQVNPLLSGMCCAKPDMDALLMPRLRPALPLEDTVDVRREAGADTKAEAVELLRLGRVEEPPEEEPELL